MWSKENFLKVFELHGNQKILTVKMLINLKVFKVHNNCSFGLCLIDINKKMNQDSFNKGEYKKMICKIRRNNFIS